MTTPMDYAAAKREARRLLGKHADVRHVARPFFPVEVGVWSTVDGTKHFTCAGAGASFEEALKDVQQNLTRVRESEES